MRQRHIILIAVLMTLLPSCILEMEVTPAQPDTVELMLCGDIVVPESALGDDAVPTKADAVPTIDSLRVPTIDSLRVLVFDASGSLVSNTVFNSGWTGPKWSDTDTAYISSISGSEQGRNQILASVGTNYVYLVVNERVGGDNLVSQLQAVQSKTVMDNIRTTKVEYTDLIPVNDADEPPFLMCVYDTVTVSGGQVTQLDITGLSTSNPIYGFPMRRTMAKIILGNIYGGVSINDRTILGTDLKYDENSSSDQTGDNDKVNLNKSGEVYEGQSGNVTLAKTSNIFVTKMELINVPSSYSWAQESNYSANAFLSNQVLNGAYNFSQDPNVPQDTYFDKNWKGSIVASGGIDFSRIDSFPVFYKQEANKGGNSYDIGESYPFSSEPDPTSDDAEFNSGNFIPWVSALYSGDHIIEGIVVPKFESMRLTSVLDPAAWHISSIGGKNAYYVPENIQSVNDRATMLRIYLSIGKVMVNVDEEEIQKIINESLADEKIPIIKEDGTEITITGKDVSYVIQQAKAIRNPTTEGDGLGSQGQSITQDLAWGICYDGINAIWHGQYNEITNQEGYYYVDTVTQVLNTYVDVPLYNSKDNTNNIYRGTEYRVNLYFTDAITIPATRSGEDTNSVTFNVDGQEYALTASVSVK